MKTLTRSRDNKWIGGVCGGIATYTSLDANLIRLIVVVLNVLGFGSVAVAYVVAWALMPLQPPGSGASAWTQASDSPATPNGPAPPSA